MGELDYTPPVEEIPDSQFGGYVPDAIYPVQVTSYQLQDNGRNAWIRAKITDDAYSAEGEFSMNLYLPTKAALNEKAHEKGSKEEALKSFFHYKQTCKAVNLPVGITIAEALTRMVGWKGKAKFQNRPGFATNIEKFLPGDFGTVPAAPPGEVAKDMPF